MNTGIFGEGFPYSNFHDLNMDWIIKIAKDFLDQYTHIQEIIEQGEEDISNLTEESLTELENKTTELTGLLDQWYETHSADIANALADALSDLNTWYTNHINSFDTYYDTKLTNFGTAVDSKTAESIASIPADYTELAQQEEINTRNLINIANFSNNVFLWEQGTAYKNSGTNVITTEANSLRCRSLPVRLNPSMREIIANTGYEVYIYVCTFDGTTYTSVYDFGWVTHYDVSQYVDTYYIVVVAKKSNNGEIYPTNASENISFTTESQSVNTIEDGFAMLPRISNSWYVGSAYKNNQGNISFDYEIDTRCFLRLNNNMLNGEIIADSGYGVVAWACTFSGNTYHVVHTFASSYVPQIDLEDYMKDYSIIVCCKKDTNGTINAEEANAHIKFKDRLNREIDDITISSLCDIVEPVETLFGQGYYSRDNEVLNVPDGILKKYSIEANKKYIVDTEFTGAESYFPLVSYFDSSNNFISYEYINYAGEATRIKKQLTIPANASWFYVNSRYYKSKVYTYIIPELTLHELTEYTRKSVSILFIGNSLTQDGIAYLPYMLSKFYPEISFKFYMAYIGGADLEDYYTAFTNSTNFDCLSISENSYRWTNYYNNKTIDDVLSTYTFDIVCMQEYFNYKQTYTDTDITTWNNCRDYIISNYTGGNALEFVSLFHAPLRSNATSVFNLTETGNALILKKTISEDMIPIGIAIYRAMDTDLDNLGDQGHLSADGTHAQEGLPCLLQTYCAMCWLFDKYSINKSIYGTNFKMTSAIQSRLEIPGANTGTGVIEGTTAQNLLAQEVAIKAYKEGKQFVIENLH